MDDNRLLKWRWGAFANASDAATHSNATNHDARPIVDATTDR